MGAYNDVVANLRCPRCERHVDVIVQFKYGLLGLFHYSVGDAIERDPRDERAQPPALVVADGECCACPNCGYDDDWPVFVVIENGKITRVTEVTDEFDFVEHE
jgi:hypothetical protein